jgi:hypothetical protein
MWHRVAPSHRGFFAPTFMTLPSLELEGATLEQLAVLTPLELGPIL